MDRYVDVKGTSLLLSPIEQKHPEHIPLSQQFRKQRQKPGSGVLDVQCLHVGPTLVVRITDRADKNCSMPSSSNRRRHSSGSRMRHKSPKRHRKTSEVENDITTARPKWSLETRLEIPAGLGISVVNNQHEELLYALFKGVELTVINTDNTYQMTGSVAVIQVNNQLLYAEKWPVLYCEVNAMKSDPDQMDYEQSPRLIKPALKLEMSCNPREHYDAFDVSLTLNYGCYFAKFYGNSVAFSASESNSAICALCWTNSCYGRLLNSYKKQERRKQSALKVFSNRQTLNRPTSPNWKQSQEDVTLEHWSWRLETCL